MTTIINIFEFMGIIDILRIAGIAFLSSLCTVVAMFMFYIALLLIGRIIIPQSKMSAKLSIRDIINGFLFFYGIKMGMV